MSRILIIENQYTQFKQIRALLEKSGEYEVYPRAGNAADEDRNYFKQVIDAARIALNPRYGARPVGFGVAALYHYIEDEMIEALIVDYKLVGNDIAENGIDLVRKLRTYSVKVPVLFLSRTSDFSPEIEPLISDDFLSPCEWLPKGYADQEILEERYFEEKVLPQLKKMLYKGNRDETIVNLMGIFRHKAWFTALKTDERDFVLNNAERIHEFTPEMRSEIEYFRLNAISIPLDQKRTFIEKYISLIEKCMNDEKSTK